MPLEENNDAYFSLQRTERALELIKEHGDKYWSNNITEFRSAWSDLLIYGGRTFTKSEQLAKLLKNSSWFDKYRNDRKNNPLLSYLWHARNVDEHHGVAETYKHEEGKTDVTAVVGKPFGVQPYVDVNGHMFLIPTTPWTKIVNHVGKSHTLVHVVDRGQRYDPPLKGAIAMSPVDSATDYVDYLSAMISDLKGQRLKTDP